MAEDTKIPWCDHTHNFVHGCSKVSEGCKFCFAEALSRRWGRECWGDNPRRLMSDSYWRKPLAWNKRCEENGVRQRVFMGSMCDGMEDHEDLVEPRARLWGLIDATPHLDWLLLTKRPENYARFLPAPWLKDGCPQNVWVGCTAENQDNYDHRASLLAPIRAVVRFLSIEPMLGHMNLGLIGTTPKSWGYGYSMVGSIINWIIVGAESGPKRRPFDLDWARSIRDECIEANVPFFFKQIISPSGRKVETPELDGRRWVQTPSDLEFFEHGYL